MSDRGEGRPAEHVVYGLVSASGELGWISWRNANRPAAWRAVWTKRAEIKGSKLATWLCSLDAEPGEVVLLGGAARMNGQEAEAIAGALAALAMPVVPAPRPWERGPVGIVKGTTLTWWPSQVEAAHSLGTTRFALYRRLRSGGAVRIP
jgi:hypothetical protein